MQCLGSEDIVLKIPTREMTRVLIHFGKSVPVIFYYVTDQMGVKVRSLLDMNKSEDPYFDPSSSGENLCKLLYTGIDCKCMEMIKFNFFLAEPQRRITLLPEHITESNRMNINDIFKGTNLMRDLSHEEANQILVRSAPREVCSLFTYP